MDIYVIFENFLRAITYDPKEPMLFNSGLFLLFFTIFITIYAFIYNNVKTRLLYVLSFSLFFYYKSSGWYLFILLLTVVIDFFIALIIHKTKDQNQKKILLVVSIIANLGLLFYFKYTNFLLQNFYALADLEFTKLDIFLPIGISFYTFQTISYVVDVYKGQIKPCRNLLDYAFYMSFFPHLVAGPIVRARDFLHQVRQKIVFKKEDMGEAMFLIMKGLIKKAIIADYMAQYADIIYSNPAGYSGFENLMAMYAYALQIYCDFSGYSDMAIGIALLMGYRLLDNFKNPYVSLDITEFWRRWHISLSSWLRDYVYIPMGGNRKGKFNQYVFLLLTMLIGGFWHGADWKFVFWGGMHGLGLAFHKLFSDFCKERGWKFAYLNVFWCLLTFHFVAFLWIFFRVESFEVAIISIEKIFFEMDVAFIEPFWNVRMLFCVILVMGYVLHFIPEKLRLRAREIYTYTPVLIKALILIIIIQAVIQIQSENVQPFIYFQF